MTTNNKGKTEEIQQQLSDLKLKGMAGIFGAMAEDGSLSRISAASVVEKMIIEETQKRRNTKSDRLINKADLFYKDAGIAGIKHDPRRRMNLPMLDSLLTCDFILKSQPVWILGASGTGKSYISCVLGKQACLLQYSVKYYSTSDFLCCCSDAAKTGTFRNFLDQMHKYNLVILDDFLLTGITFEEATYLFEFLNCRPLPQRPRSVIITSQLKEEEMKLRIGDVSPALSESIMGRLRERHLELIITGESMRDCG